LFTQYSPLIGFTAISAIDATAHILTKPGTAYSNLSIFTIMHDYITRCRAIDLNAALAIGQMLHETGYLTSFWAQRPQRNPAGLGITGKAQKDRPARLDGWAYNTQRKQWEVGISFPTWVNHAIPAHLGRLLAYALRDDEATPEQRTLIDMALNYRPLDKRLRGRARTLAGLDGRWAYPGVGYGGRIAKAANRLMGYSDRAAQVRRAA
jgi:hypothetical protein